MAKSSIPVVKAAIITRLQADAGLAGVQVVYGHPYPKMPAREVLFLGDALDGDPTNGQTPYAGGQRSASLGQQRREERYVLQGYVIVAVHARESQQTVTERAFAIAAIVEASMRVWNPQSSDWPALSSGFVHWVQIASTEHAEGKNPQETMAAVHIQFAVAARI